MNEFDAICDAANEKSWAGTFARSDWEEMVRATIRLDGPLARQHIHTAVQFGVCEQVVTVDEALAAVKRLRAELGAPQQ